MNNEKLKNTYVVIDIETSGLNCDSDEIIKLSALKIEDGKITGTFSSLIKSVKSLSENVESLTGITNADLADKCAIIDLLPDFLRFIGDNTLVAHNIEFDIKFINAALKKTRLKAENGAKIKKLPNTAIDTLDLARERCLLRKYTLRHVMDFLGIPQSGVYTENVFFLYEKLKTLPARKLSRDRFDYMEDLRKTAKSADVPENVRMLCGREYRLALCKLPREEILSLRGEELEVFSRSHADDWQPPEKSELDTWALGEIYVGYMKSIPKNSPLYNEIYSRVYGYRYKDMTELSAATDVDKLKNANK